MAISLERMKELEEQVKLIPVLQVSGEGGHCETQHKPCTRQATSPFRACRRFYNLETTCFRRFATENLLKMFLPRSCRLLLTVRRQGRTEGGGVRGRPGGRVQEATKWAAN